MTKPFLYEQITNFFEKTINFEKDLKFTPCPWTIDYYINFLFLNFKNSSHLLECNSFYDLLLIKNKSCLDDFLMVAYNSFQTAFSLAIKPLDSNPEIIAKAFGINLACYRINHNFVIKNIPILNFNNWENISYIENLQQKLNFNDWDYEKVYRYLQLNSFLNEWRNIKNNIENNKQQNEEYNSFCDSFFKSEMYSYFTNKLK